MNEIARGIDLYPGVDGLTQALRSQIKALHEYRTKKDTLSADSDAQELARIVAKNNGNIHDRAVELIEQIAKIDVSDK
mgnify:CR=1 FL=1